MKDVVICNNIIIAEFKSWIEDICNQLPEKESERKYYVYALCEKHGDKLKPFYIGKGVGGRVWSHEDEAAKEQEEIIKDSKKYGYSEEDLKLRLETVKAKLKKISDLGSEHIAHIIVKSGLTEYESFMCESALINLLRLDGFEFSGTEPLTNIANGHSNIFEKTAGIKTAALTVEEYYENYCKKPIIKENLPPEFKDKTILLRNIKMAYNKCVNKSVFPTPEEQNEAIREAVRAFWKESDPCKNIDYIFAMYEGRIKGVYKVLKTKDEQNNEVLFHRSLDVTRSDFPSFDKLDFRVKDFHRSNAICSDLEKQGLIDKTDPYKGLTNDLKANLYSRLTDTTKKLCPALFPGYEEYLKKNKLTDSHEAEKEYFSKEICNWVKRKYFVLEDIVEGVDPDFKQYINCAILEKRGNKYESIFAGESTTDDEGKIKRGRAKQYVVLK